MSFPSSMSSISVLEETARRLCRIMGGNWSGTKGMACCPAHDDRTPSLSVTLGRRAILFHCFAGCDRASILAALAGEGFEARTLFAGDGQPHQTGPGPQRKASAAAVRLWSEARPLPGSPARAYLESRGILAGSAALRFHPRTPLGPKGRTTFLPAMVAAVSLDEGPIAVQRTYLKPGVAAKADFARPKRALGYLGRAAVRLLAPANGKLGLAEGIESAMSAYALTGIPTWATLGNERFGLVAVPDCVTELHLFTDHDAGGAIAAEKGLAAYCRADRSIQVRRATGRDNDWNDELSAWLQRKASSRK